MMTNEEKDSLEKIADYYGYEIQSRQLIEEMAELTQAVNKLWRRFPEIRNEDIAKVTASHEYTQTVEELADVQIMLFQVEHLLHCDLAVELMVNSKIERQKGRMSDDGEARP